MYPNSQIAGAAFSADIDSADVGIEKSFMVNTSLLHTRKHLLIAKVAEGRVVDLNVSCDERLEGVFELDKQVTHDIQARTVL